MGAKVGRFMVAVGKAAAKGLTTFVGNKVPVLGPIVANKLNSMYAKGGTVKFEAGGEVPAGLKKMVVNSPAALLKLVEKEPEIAAKVGLTPEMVKEGIEKAKEGEAIVVKRRGGKAKAKAQPSEDTVVLQKKRGGLVPSIF